MQENASRGRGGGASKFLQQQQKSRRRRNVTTPTEGGGSNSTYYDVPTTQPASSSSSSIVAKEHDPTSAENIKFVLVLRMLAECLLSLRWLIALLVGVALILKTPKGGHWNASLLLLQSVITALVTPLLVMRNVHWLPAFAFGRLCYSWFNYSASYIKRAPSDLSMAASLFSIGVFLTWNWQPEFRIERRFGGSRLGGMPSLRFMSGGNNSRMALVGTCTVASILLRYVIQFITKRIATADILLKILVGGSLLRISTETNGFLELVLNACLSIVAILATQATIMRYVGAMDEALQSRLLNSNEALYHAAVSVSAIEKFAIAVHIADASDLQGVATPSVLLKVSPNSGCNDPLDDAIEHRIPAMGSPRRASRFSSSTNSSVGGSRMAAYIYGSSRTPSSPSLLSQTAAETTNACVAPRGHDSIRSKFWLKVWHWLSFENHPNIWREPWKLWMAVICSQWQKLPLVGWAFGYAASSVFPNLLTAVDFKFPRHSPTAIKTRQPLEPSVAFGWRRAKFFMSDPSDATDLQLHEGGAPLRASSRILSPEARDLLLDDKLLRSIVPSFNKWIRGFAKLGAVLVSMALTTPTGRGKEGRHLLRLNPLVLEELKSALDILQLQNPAASAEVRLLEDGSVEFGKAAFFSVQEELQISVGGMASVLIIYLSAIENVFILRKQLMANKDSKSSSSIGSSSSLKMATHKDENYFPSLATTASSLSDGRAAAESIDRVLISSDLLVLMKPLSLITNALVVIPKVPGNPGLSSSFRTRLAVLTTTVIAMSKSLKVAFDINSHPQSDSGIVLTNLLSSSWLQSIYNNG